MTALTVDNVAYDLVHATEIKRSFSVLDGPNTGRVQTGEMRRDIIGTYYNYTMSLVADASPASIAQYDALYEVLSAPDVSHIIKVPYAQGYKEYKAYVTNGEDGLRLKTERGANWEGLSVNFIAMVPARVPA